MTVETDPSSRSEIPRVALSAPVMAQQPPWGRSRELEKANSGDDEDFSLVVVSSSPRWPRIFPGL
jgi:hypothetical protein